MTLFSSARRSHEHPYGLRRHRYFANRQYYLAIIIDLAIRFSWLSRYVPGFVWMSETEFGIFVLMFSEVARRWMWVFLRVEAEWSKSPIHHTSTLPWHLQLTRGTQQQSETAAVLPPTIFSLASSAANWTQTELIQPCRIFLDKASRPFLYKLT